jgi:hypothetical protein
MPTLEEQIRQSLAEGENEKMPSGTKPPKNKSQETPGQAAHGSEDDHGGVKPDAEPKGKESNSGAVGKNATKNVKETDGKPKAKGGTKADPHPVGDRGSLGTTTFPTGAQDKVKTKLAKEDLDSSDAIGAILGEGTEGLSEEFKTRIQTVYEAAVVGHVNEIVEGFVSELSEAAEKEVEKKKDELEEKVDQYLNYVVSNWLQENQLAIENGTKNEILENFINKMKGVFAESYIELPEETVDVLSAKDEEIVSLKEELNVVKRQLVEKATEADEGVKDRIISEVADGLAFSQAEKLKNLSEGVEYKSAEDFRARLEMVKENFFPSTSTKQNLNEDAAEEAEDGADDSAMIAEEVAAVARILGGGAKARK